jgi:hypothetical protein
VSGARTPDRAAARAAVQHRIFPRPASGSRGSHAEACQRIRFRDVTQRAEKIREEAEAHRKDTGRSRSFASPDDMERMNARVDDPLCHFLNRGQAV